MPRLTTGDLALTAHDALLSKLRATLRRDYAFPRGDKKFITAIYSNRAAGIGAGGRRRRARLRRLRLGDAHDREHGPAGGGVCAG